MYFISVTCESLTDPKNGLMTCSLGGDGGPFYTDTCNFMCNIGYLLSGSYTRSCEIDGNWSGSETVCRKGKILLYCVQLHSSEIIL